MIKPTIGRKLWFWKTRDAYNASAANNHDHTKVLVADQPEDATVVAVWSPGVVNLYVVDHDGVGQARTSVPLLQEGDHIPVKDFATWMPFQVGQAKAQAKEAS